METARHPLVENTMVGPGEQLRRAPRMGEMVWADVGEAMCLYVALTIEPDLVEMDGKEVIWFAGDTSPGFDNVGQRASIHKDAEGRWWTGPLLDKKDIP